MAMTSIIKIFLLITNYHILILGILSINIDNTQDFIETINNYNNNKDEIFNIQNEIIITDIEPLIIKKPRFLLQGNPSHNSILNFTDNNDINLIFQKECEFIEIKDITIFGVISFEHNLNITFNNVIYNGYFISRNDFSNQNNTISIKDSVFSLSQRYHGLSINNYDVTITNTKFYGNQINNLYIMSVMNSKDNFKNLIIKDTLFSGNYHNSGIDSIYTNIQCNNSTFQKLYNGKRLRGGGALNLAYTNNNFYNNKFEDNFSESNGGSIYLINTYITTIDVVYFTNTTSLESGHSISIFSENTSYKTIIYMYNITQVGNPIKNPFSIDGTFFSTYGSNKLYIENYTGTNLSTGTVMSFSGDSRAEIKNMNINTVYSENEGPLIKVYDPYMNGANIYYENLQVNNIIQENSIYSPSLISTISGKVTLYNCTFQNFFVNQSGLTFQENDGVIVIRNSFIINFFSKWPEPLFYINNFDYLYLTYDDSPYAFIFDYSVLSNVYEDGVIFYINRCKMHITNSSFYNIHQCYLNNDCNSFTEIMDDKFRSSIIFFIDILGANILQEFTTFDSIYGKTGIIVKQGVLSITFSIIKNSYFENGFIFLTNLWESDKGYFFFYGMEFSNNRSYRGTFFYYNDIYGDESPTVLTVDSKFINNTAINYGGLIYSTARGNTNIYNKVNFYECLFENNNAILGKISYTYDSSHNPLFYNSDNTITMKLNEDKNNYVTNPTHLVFDNYDSKEIIEIYSGDRIDKEYSCSIYDDNGNRFEINGDINDTLLNELVFYEISLQGKNDTSLRAKVFGSYRGYCFNNICKFKNLRLIGNPGDYMLILKIVSSGSFFDIKSNSIYMNIKIKECNETERLNQDKDGYNIKSCFIPKCNPPCVRGKCINDNICDCSNTKFKGPLCSERYQQERHKFYEVLIIVISNASILIYIISLIFLHLHRNFDIIKAASFDFLALILIGLIFNSIYVFLIIKKTFSNLECALVFLIQNIGFSLIFGSITSKTFRIYRIFYSVKAITHKPSNTMKFLLIDFLIAFYIIFSIIHYFTNSIESKIAFDYNEREYSQCVYPKDEIICFIINLFIIIIEFYFSYNIRRINQTFKEPLTIPFYTYIIYIFFIYIFKILKNPKLSYYFTSSGTLFYSAIIFYFFYIKKFKMILKYGNKKIDDSDIRTNDKLSKIGTNWLNRYELTECSRIESNPYATGFVQYSIK